MSGSQRPAWLGPAGIGFVLFILGAAALVGGGMLGLAVRQSADTPAPGAATARPTLGFTPARVASETPVPVIPTRSPTPTPGEAATETLLAGTPTPESASTNTPAAESTSTPTAAGSAPGGGGRLAFISNRDGQFFQVYTMNPDGSDVQQVTFDPSNKWDPRWTFNGTQLAWSPDGTKLLYVADGGAGNDLDLWMIDADGSNQVDLTNALGDDFQPTWCADGTIWFTSTRVNGARQLFFTTLEQALQETRPRNFSATHGSPIEYDVTLFPGCQRLIFVSTSVDGHELRRYFLDGTSNRGFRKEQSFNAIAEEPAVSPDGQNVAYTSIQLATGAHEIIVTKADDRLSREKLTNTLNNSAPQWSPDSGWIVFVSRRDQNSEIYLMTISGTEQRNLTQHPATDTDPVWQPAP